MQLRVAVVASTPMWRIHPGDPRMTLDVLLPEREAFWEKLYVSRLRHLAGQFP
jgi:hypothetical protein